MSTNQLTPVWLIHSGDMSGDLASDPVTTEFNDNVGIQVTWTGTPTGVLDVQVSMDITNLGWQSVPFDPSPSQPAGADGSNWYEINQTPAGFVRLIYTAASGAGVLKAKIAAKSV